MKLSVHVISLLAFAAVANQSVRAQNPRISAVAATPSPSDPHDPVTGGVQVPPRRRPARQPYICWNARDKTA